jgi:hypothetical protein
VDRLKAELLLISKQIGDIGTTATHTRWIGKFVEALQQHFTDAGIESFTAEQLRGPYVEYMTLINNDVGWDVAADAVVTFFHAHRDQRERRPVDIGVNSSVVDMFRKKS